MLVRQFSIIAYVLKSENLKHLGSLLINQNSIHEEIKSKQRIILPKLFFLLDLQEFEKQYIYIYISNIIASCAKWFET